MLRLVEPTGGTVSFDGIDVHTLEGEDLRRMRRRMQMIFQDPMASLDPRQSIESVLTEPRRAHGIEVGGTRTVPELLDLVGLPSSAAWRYPHEFSGGQRQRIGIARAIALDPDLIIADEPVSALDVSIQAQVVNLLEELQDRLGLTYVVIAHDLAVVRHIADVVAVMYLGGIVEQAPSDSLYADPFHPYTKALMSAVPIPDPVIEDTGCESCCLGTFRRRRTRRPAAGSTPAVRTGSGPVVTTSGRRCGSWRPAIPSPAIGPRTSPPGRSHLGPTLSSLPPWTRSRPPPSECQASRIPRPWARHRASERPHSWRSRRSTR